MLNGDDSRFQTILILVAHTVVFVVYFYKALCINIPGMIRHRKHYLGQVVEFLSGDAADLRISQNLTPSMLISQKSPTHSSLGDEFNAVETKSFGTPNQEDHGSTVDAKVELDDVRSIMV